MTSEQMAALDEAWRTLGDRDERAAPTRFAELRLITRDALAACMAMAISPWAEMDLAILLIIVLRHVNIGDLLPVQREVVERLAAVAFGPRETWAPAAVADDPCGVAGCTICHEAVGNRPAGACGGGAIACPLARTGPSLRRLRDDGED